MNRAGIEALLPDNYRRAVLPDSPLSALLDLIEALHAPPERVVADVDVYFDCLRAPDRFVPYLARWVDLGPLLDDLANELGEGEFPTGNGRLRGLVQLAAYFSKWRGTKRGLIAFLEVATGVPGFEVEEQPGDRPFHLRVVAPRGTESSMVLIESIVELEKPAYTTHELAFGS